MYEIRIQSDKLCPANLRRAHASQEFIYGHIIHEYTWGIFGSPQYIVIGLDGKRYLATEEHCLCPEHRSNK